MTRYGGLFQTIRFHILSSLPFICTGLYFFFHLILFFFFFFLNVQLISNRLDKLSESTLLESKEKQFNVKIEDHLCLYNALVKIFQGK